MNVMLALVNQSILPCSKSAPEMGVLATAEYYCADMLARESRGFVCGLLLWIWVIASIFGCHHSLVVFLCYSYTSCFCSPSSPSWVGSLWFGQLALSLPSSLVSLHM